MFIVQQKLSSTMIQRKFQGALIYEMLTQRLGRESLPRLLAIQLSKSMSTLNSEQLTIMTCT